MIVESLKEVKMYVKFSNNVEAEQRGSYLDVEGIEWKESNRIWKMLGKNGEKVIACMSQKLMVLMKMLYRGVGRRSEAKNEFEIDVRRSDLVLMPRVVKSRDEIFSRWGYCDNHDLSRLDNQSIERDRLIGIGFVLDFVEFISFTFGDKEMISVIEAVSR
ncbi:hypothetical protein Tco_1216672 [Tanacetum coccineum]